MTSGTDILQETIGAPVAGYLAQRWRQQVVCNSCTRIPGGASRETYRLQLQVDGTAQGVIVRRDPPSSLIDTERAHEYLTYAAVYPTTIPVPEPLVLEESTAVLERPFSITREIPGCESAIGLFAQPPYLALRESIAEQKWSLLGTLATCDIDALALDHMQRPTHPAKHELAYWANVIEQDAQQPQPIAAAAIRALERTLPPPPRRLALVHGDYRSGNFLYQPDGQIRGILDWEMAHLGDPLEDLAWSLDPIWCFPERQLAGGLVSRRAALAIWQQASGLEIDPQTLRWWQLFASLKALAIWISSAQDYIHGSTKEPILAYAGWPMIDRQNRILLDRLDPESQHAIAEPLL